MLKIFHFFLSIIEFNYKRKLLIELTKRCSNKINTFFDVGAHYGETSLWLNKKIDIKEIHLFEPNVISFNKLKKSLSRKLNDKKLFFYNFALGDNDHFSNLNEVIESSSSTINKINIDSKYYKRKKRILELFNIKDAISAKKIKIVNTSNFLKLKEIKYIDLLKIDTEGYEYKILKNIDSYLKNIKVILFEHHYDLMIIKNYKFSDIDYLLKKNNFVKVYKAKMLFRKSFEYIYINTKQT